jgi:uncharacterized protein (DUF2147 family)
VGALRLTGPFTGATMRIRRVGEFIVLAAMVIALMAGSAPARASPVDGNWAIRDLVLEIFNCQQSVCGKVVWTKDPQRRRLDCGRTIVWGLSPVGPEAWSGGSIYDPTDGNTYRLSATLQPDGTLHARIYRGAPLFGKTEVLRKVSTRSLDGWCS